MREGQRGWVVNDHTVRRTGFRIHRRRRTIPEKHSHWLSVTLRSREISLSYFVRLFAASIDAQLKS